jgi:hypothetical protein
MVVQDATGGIYVSALSGVLPDLRAGLLVELDGVSGPGDFAPVVTQPRVRVLGEQALPEPQPVNLERLFTGAADSAWVAVEGVVYSLSTANGRAMMGIRAGAYRLQAAVAGIRTLPETLLYARVRVRGVCAPRFNFKRQVLGMNIRVPDRKYIEVVANAAPAEAEERAIGQLLQFSPDSDANKPSRVGGVVMMTHPTGPTYVNDDSGGVMIESHRTWSWATL